MTITIMGVIALLGALFGLGVFAWCLFAKDDSRPALPADLSGPRTELSPNADRPASCPRFAACKPSQAQCNERYEVHSVIALDQACWECGHIVQCHDFIPWWTRYE